MKQALSAERAHKLEDLDRNQDAQNWVYEKERRVYLAAERREQVKQRLEQLKIKKEEQKKQFEAVRLKVKQVKNHKKPLYKMLEESFEKEQMEQEKVRKQKL